MQRGLVEGKIAGVPNQSQRVETSPLRVRGFERDSLRGMWFKTESLRRTGTANPTGEAPTVQQSADYFRAVRRDRMSKKQDRKAPEGQAEPRSAFTRVVAAQMVADGSSFAELPKEKEKWRNRA